MRRRVARRANGPGSTSSGCVVLRGRDGAAGLQTRAQTRPAPVAAATRFQTSSGTVAAAVCTASSAAARSAQPAPRSSAGSCSHAGGSGRNTCSARARRIRLQAALLHVCWAEVSCMRGQQPDRAVPCAHHVVDGRRAARCSASCEALPPSQECKALLLHALTCAAAGLEQGARRLPAVVRAAGAWSQSHLHAMPQTVRVKQHAPHQALFFEAVAAPSRRASRRRNRQPSRGGASRRACCASSFRPSRCVASQGSCALLTPVICQVRAQHTGWPAHRL